MSSLIYLIKKGTIVSVMVVMFMSMINFSDNLKRSEVERDIGEFDLKIQIVQSVVLTDNLRQLAVKKVLGIITTYNKVMSQEEKAAIANEIYNMSVKYDNLDLDLICATITHESARTWRANVASPAGAKGLMQIMPYTGSYLSEHEGIVWTTADEVLFDPINNIKMGCRYLSMLIELYQIDGGLAAYNGGERRAAKWLASGRKDEVLFKETRDYVPAVLKLYDHYRN